MSASVVKQEVTEKEYWLSGVASASISILSGSCPEWIPEIARRIIAWLVSPLKFVISFPLMNVYHIHMNGYIYIYKWGITICLQSRY